MIPSSPLIRLADLNDSISIGVVHHQTWQDEPCDLTQIKNILVQPNHWLFVAVIDNQICGFIDNFITRSYSGSSRWEVDLLAVHPDFRNQGIGKALVTASVKAARSNGVYLARALIREENTASQRVFRRCGFNKLDGRNSLYVRNAKTGTVLSPPDEDGYFIEVNTINYHGIWLEDIFSQNAFHLAITKACQVGASIAGAVLPVEDTRVIQWASEAGYDFIGNYQWWYHRL